MSKGRTDVPEVDLKHFDIQFAEGDKCIDLRKEDAYFAGGYTHIYRQEGEDTWSVACCSMDTPNIEALDQLLAELAEAVAFIKDQNK